MSSSLPDSESFPELAIITCSLDGAVLSVNGGAERMFGQTADAVVGQPMAALLGPQEPALWSMLEGRPMVVHDTAMRLRRHGGDVFDAIVTVAPMRDPSGRTVGAMMICRSTRPLARTPVDRALVEAAQHLTQSMFVWRKEGADEASLRLLYANATAAALMSTPASELIGGAIFDLFPSWRSSSQLFRCLDAMSQGVVTDLGEFRWEGGVRPAAFTGLAIPVGSEMVVVALDHVTRDRAFETQSQQAERMATLGRLAGGVAHDFNNLLTAILGYSDLLMEDATDESTRAYLAEIQQAAGTASTLTQRLLAFSRKQGLEPTVQDLNEIVWKMEGLLRRLLGEHIDLVLKCQAPVAKVSVDPGQIEQMVLNLAVNARDAMPAGGLLVIETAIASLDPHYAARHVGVRPGRYVMLAVSDTGVGMDNGTLARVFEPFFTTRAESGGTGMGLTTVYGIAKQHKGNVWVYSEAGRGATFKVYLPAVDQGTAGVERVESRSGDDRRGGDVYATILLVEDDAGVRSLTREVLSRHGYHVVDLATGNEALTFTESRRYDVDLLLTDVVLRGMTGPALAEELRRRRPNLPVVMMSGYTDEVIARQGILAVDIPFLQKPFAPEALLAKVRDALKNP